MHLWSLDDWGKKYSKLNQPRRCGLRLVCDKNIDPEVRQECKDFVKWLRSEYLFPMRIPIYVKAAEQIKARDGTMVSATFWGPDDRMQEPFIRAASGDYYALAEKHGKGQALLMILHSIAHELTHYYQWINDVKLTLIGEERQATTYADHIIQEYIAAKELKNSQDKSDEVS